MAPRTLTFALAILLAASVASADQARQRRPPDSGSQSGGDSGQAVPRTAQPRESPPPPPPAAAPAPAPRTESPRSSGPRVSSSAPEPQPRVAQPRERRPPEGSGSVAVPRGSVPGPPPPSGGRVDRYWPRVYNNHYYYYPRRYYPYGYGSFGLGYFYYDPYSWYPYDTYAYPFRGYGYGYPTGELRLDVRPHYAEVYVDGYYAGIVDDFDGIFQSLTLEEGPYRIEVVAPGYETLVFNVRVQPGRKITYRGDMRRFRP
jgi:hypothetical protein